DGVIPAREGGEPVGGGKVRPDFAFGALARLAGGGCHGTGDRWRGRRVIRAAGARRRGYQRRKRVDGRSPPSMRDAKARSASSSRLMTPSMPVARNREGGSLDFPHQGQSTATTSGGIMQLTENFSFEELTASDTAARAGIDNTPPDALMTNLQ